MKSATGTRMAALRRRITSFFFSLAFSFLFSLFFSFLSFIYYKHWRGGIAVRAHTSRA